MRPLRCQIAASAFSRLAVRSVGLKASLRDRFAERLPTNVALRYLDRARVKSLSEAISQWRRHRHDLTANLPPAGAAISQPKAVSLFPFIPLLRTKLVPFFIDLPKCRIKTSFQLLFSGSSGDDLWEEINSGNLLHLIY